MKQALIGFFIGLMMAGALAQTANPLIIGTTGYITALAYSRDPTNNVLPIKIDANGYVICSTEPK